MRQVVLATRTWHPALWATRVRDRAQDPSLPLHSLTADDDEVRSDLVRHPDDDVGRISDIGVDLHIEALDRLGHAFEHALRGFPQNRTSGGSEKLAPPEGTATAVEEWTPDHEMESRAVLPGDLNGQRNRLTRRLRAVGADDDA